MHDSLAVEELEADEDLPRVLPHHRLVQRSEVGDEGGDAPTRDVLEEDVEPTLVGLGPQVLDDVVVLQHLHHVDLPLQGPDGLRALLLVVLEAHLREEDLLHRHQLPRVRVNPLVHLRVRSFPNQATESPSQQLLAGAAEVGAAVTELADRHGLAGRHSRPSSCIRPLCGGREPGVNLLIYLLVLSSRCLAVALHLGRSHDGDLELLPSPPLRQRQGLVQLSAAG
mmetsp:Transcript_44568/g.140641  ORF Transcript_44568/g.140641 Transcript_44568/m.140641 type:complete len:225 (+) Transcript_44568:817-1491(+)